MMMTRKFAKKGGSRKAPASATQTTTPRMAPFSSPPSAPQAGHRIWVVAPLAIAIIVAIGFVYEISNGPGRSSVGASAPAFVGSEACAGCHQAEAELWRSSHHNLAMEHATDKSVLGDFSDATFEYYSVKSRFFRKDGKFFVETDGPDGEPATFEVKYTFGVAPLQQYLVEFPDGRLQALSLAWDSRPKEEGGQRWFHLYPSEEIKHDDVLHWTKLGQNWNFMCAACHSTGVHKNYDAARDRFATSWAEISVGCEACHGQSSQHVDWARARNSWWPFGKRDDPAGGLAVRFDERQDITWRRDTQTGNARRSFAPALLRKEVETCGRCHARGAELSEDWAPGRWLSDTHLVSPLARDLYQADGQMLDEVYNYGSFKQSKMFAAGVTCSDCHDPHSARLRLPGDGVCLQCHSAEKYAAVAHHRHEAVNPPLACASCHMPVRTYMVVDRRHDHSIRVPRPDLSVQLGTSNACNDCHSDKPPEWAASAIERWHGPSRKGFQTYAEAFHAAWSDDQDAARLLAVVASDSMTPSFARSSALTELASRLSPANIKLAQAGLADADPMVRIGALDMLENVPAARIWPLVSPLLSDSSRGVRIRAIALLAAVPTASQPLADRGPFDRAAAEFIAAQRLNADRPEARATLGSFFALRGLTAEAETEYKAGLRLNPRYTPATVNLADLYRQIGRDGDGESLLRTAIAASPQDAELHHALGLALIRLKRSGEALGELRRAFELAPGQARYGYVYAVGLNSVGRAGDAIAALKGNLARHPADRDSLAALVNFTRDTGDFVSALEFAGRLARVAPGDPGIAGLVEDVRRRAAKASVP
jgi:predicted CXXCH cytochrome family protein